MRLATRPHRLRAPPDHLRDTRQRPVTESRPERGRDGTPAITRAATALLLAKALSNMPHIIVRSSRGTPTQTPTMWSESTNNAR